MASEAVSRSIGGRDPAGRSRRSTGYRRRSAQQHDRGIAANAAARAHQLGAVAGSPASGSTRTGAHRRARRPRRRADIARRGWLALPACGQEIVELARILDPADVERRAGIDEAPARSRSRPAPNRSNVREKPPAIFSMRFSCEKRASRCSKPRSIPCNAGSIATPAVAAEDGVAARQIVEQANLPIQQPLCHGRSSIPCRRTRGCARRRREFRRPPQGDRRARARSSPARDARDAYASRSSVSSAASDGNGNRRGTARCRPSSCTAIPPAMCTSCTSPGDSPSMNSWESKP